MYRFLISVGFKYSLFKRIKNLFAIYSDLFQSFELWKSYSFPFFPSASFTIFVFSMSKNKEIKIMIFFQTFKVSPQRYRFTENHEGLEPLCQSFD